MKDKNGKVIKEGDIVLCRITGGSLINAYRIKCIIENDILSYHSYAICVTENDISTFLMSEPVEFYSDEIELLPKSKKLRKKILFLRKFEN